MLVAKSGNSLAVRLPAAVVEALELKEGDEIHVADARQFGIARKPGREELSRRLRAFRGRLSAEAKQARVDRLMMGGAGATPPPIPHGEAVKHIRDPVLGPLAFEHWTFAVDGRTDLSMVVYNPATREDAEWIKSLLS